MTLAIRARHPGNTGHFDVYVVQVVGESGIHATRRIRVYPSDEGQMVACTCDIHFGASRYRPCECMDLVNADPKDFGYAYQSYAFEQGED